MRNPQVSCDKFMMGLFVGAIACAPHTPVAIEYEYNSIFERDLKFSEIAPMDPLSRVSFPKGITPSRRSLMRAYERLGFPSVEECTWARFAEDASGWLCEKGALLMPSHPIYGSDEDLPQWVLLDSRRAIEVPNGFEETVAKKIASQRKYDATPTYERPEHKWLTPPRDSRHLIWTTFAYWALQRGRLDLFEISMQEVEKASDGRCAKTVKEPLAGAMLASAAASMAAAAKVQIVRGEWKQAREKAAHARSLLSAEAMAFKYGATTARDSADSVLRRAEIEIAIVDLPPPNDHSSMAVRMDHWLLGIMRSGCSMDLQGDKIARSILEQGESVVPLLLPHMNESALCAKGGGLTEAPWESWVHVYGREWFSPPTMLGDVVVRIIEDIAGQEFTTPASDKSRDIGGHLAIYAWWAGRLKIAEEEAEATKPPSLWEKIRGGWSPHGKIGRVSQ